MIKRYILSLIVLCFSLNVMAQLPTPSIVGYWESWNGNKFIELKDIDNRYNVIHIAFASLKAGKDYELSYTPPGSYTEEVFKSEVAALQAAGKKVIISIGGQNDHVMLDSIPEKDAFVASMNAMVDYWGFDGIDIDLEGSSLNFDSINVQNPGDPRQNLMITAIREMMANHFVKHGKKLILTMAPETIYVQGALSQWAGNYRGAYLPMIEALKDSIDMLNVQLYNSGSMYGLDGQSGGAFNQGTADFVVAMTEAVLLGFTATGTIGGYSGLDASKVGVALPGCHSSDAVPHKEIEAAINYLMGKGPKPGKYTLKTDGGYPNLKGMMTWSINSDGRCNPGYGFVDTWSKLFTDSSYFEIDNYTDIYEGVENGGVIQVNLFKDTFTSILDTGSWTVTNLPDGVKLDSVVRVNDSTAHVILKGNSSVDYPAAIWNVKLTADSSQFIKSTLTLSRGDGVLLKKTRTIIPGILQAEDLSGKKSAYTTGNFNGEEGLMLRYNSGYYSEYEIDVTETSKYDVDFKFASSSGSHSIILKIDGVTKKSQTVVTSSKWNEWDTARFSINLDSGSHVLKVLMNSGWMHWDWMDFKMAEPDGVNDVLGVNDIVVFPNPSSGVFQSSKKLVNAKLMSFDGKLLQQWSGTNTFNVFGIAPGTYLLLADGFHTKVIIR
ncbi:MAG: chitinase [Glaciecola sp.]|jgi:chitinase